jgi:hypothetical protein
MDNIFIHFLRFGVGDVKGSAWIIEMEASVLEIRSLPYELYTKLGLLPIG